MKSYTDLEQSKKLAEILPLESADMTWQRLYDEDNYNYIANLMPYRFYSGIGIPCWSLTALLNVLPLVDMEKEIYSYDTYQYRIKAYIGDGYVGDWFDNPIDACYDMIITLHENKLLYV